MMSKRANTWKSSILRVLLFALLGLLPTACFVVYFGIRFGSETASQLRAASIAAEHALADLQEPPLDANAALQQLRHDSVEVGKTLRDFEAAPTRLSKADYDLVRDYLRDCQQILQLRMKWVQRRAAQPDKVRRDERHPTAITPLTADEALNALQDELAETVVAQGRRIEQLQATFASTSFLSGRMVRTWSELPTRAKRHAEVTEILRQATSDIKDARRLITHPLEANADALAQLMQAERHAQTAAARIAVFSDRLPRGEIAALKEYFHAGATILRAVEDWCKAEMDAAAAGSRVDQTNEALLAGLPRSVADQLFDDAFRVNGDYKSDARESVTPLHAAVEAIRRILPQLRTSYDASVLLVDVPGRSPPVAIPLRLPPPSQQPQIASSAVREDVIFLNSLVETSKDFWQYSPKFGFSKDGQIWGQDVKDGQGERYLPIVLGGVESPHAIFAHPKPRGRSSITYDLKEFGHHVFKSTVGVADLRRYGPHTALTFEVWGDGKLLWKSQPVRKWGQPQDCEVPVKGVKTLELRCVCPGDAAFAIAVWCEPRLLSETRDDRPPLAGGFQAAAPAQEASNEVAQVPRKSNSSQPLVADENLRDASAKDVVPIPVNVQAYLKRAESLKKAKMQQLERRMRELELQITNLPVQARAPKRKELSPLQTEFDSLKKERSAIADFPRSLNAGELGFAATLKDVFILDEDLLEGTVVDINGTETPVVVRAVDTRRIQRGLRRVNASETGRIWEIDGPLKVIATAPDPDLVSRFPRLRRPRNQRLLVVEPIEMSSIEQYREKLPE